MASEASLSFLPSYKRVLTHLCKKRTGSSEPAFFGAGNGIRTRDIQLGKLTLYL